MEINKQNLRDRLLSSLEPSSLTEFFEKNTRRKPFKVKKGTLLSNEGQPMNNLFVIKEGFAKIYNLSKDGKEVNVYLLGPGNVIGATAFLSKDATSYHEVGALTNLELISLSREEYLDLIASNPEYLVDLLQIFLNRLAVAEKKLEGFIAGNLNSRVAHFLLSIHQRFENPPNLTHQQISEFVGSSREAVTIALHNLEKLGAIVLEKNEIKIKDEKLLKEQTTSL